MTEQLSSDLSDLLLEKSCPFSNTVYELFPDERVNCIEQSIWCVRYSVTGTNNYIYSTCRVEIMICLNNANEKVYLYALNIVGSNLKYSNIDYLVKKRYSRDLSYHHPCVIMHIILPGCVCQCGFFF